VIVFGVPDTTETADAELLNISPTQPVHGLAPVISPFDETTPAFEML
jgi:hypothetical protein